MREGHATIQSRNGSTVPLTLFGLTKTLDFIQLFLALSEHMRAVDLKEKVGFSRQGNSNSFVLSLFSVGHAVTMPDRNNYANNDVGILYRLYLMYLIYVHNYSAQSVDSSERMIVMLCAYLNSFPYRIFIVFYF